MELYKIENEIYSQYKSILVEYKNSKDRKNQILDFIEKFSINKSPIIFEFIWLKLEDADIFLQIEDQNSNKIENILKSKCFSNERILSFNFNENGVFYNLHLNVKENVK